MENEIETILSRVRDNKSRISSLMSEAESIRVQLGDVIVYCEPSTSVISTRLPSGAATGHQSPAPTVAGYDLNSPAASTIYMGGSTSRMIDRSRMTSGSTSISPELEKILPSVASSTHRRALLAIDRFGFNAVKWKRGFTALHWAYKEGRQDVVNFLIKKGADAEARDDIGKRPVDYRAPLQERNINRALPVQLESLPLPQRRALETMHQYGWEALKWGGGYTILHWAYQTGRMDVVEYCGSMGMPSDFREDKGMLPVDYAKASNSSN